MAESYRHQIARICAAAGLSREFGREMAEAGVSGATLKVAIDEARTAGATDLDTAVRAHEGVSAQLGAYRPVRGRGRANGPVTKARKRRRIGPALPPADGVGRDDDPNLAGWNEAFRKVADGPGAQSNTAADTQEGA